MNHDLHGYLAESIKKRCLMIAFKGDGSISFTKRSKAAIFHLISNHSSLLVRKNPRVAAQGGNGLR